MNDTVPFRRQIGRILKLMIPEGRWESTFLHLQREGALDDKTIVEILIAVCQWIEAHERQHAASPRPAD